MPYPKFKEPETIEIVETLTKPVEDGHKHELIMGPNIKPFPKFGKLPEHIEGPVLLKVGDNVSTDEILPAGAKVLPFRSNIPEISKFTFAQVDESYYDRAMKYQDKGSLIVGGKNYGQGSSREHAAISPRYLGVKAVIAKGYARIHRKNLINFGILPLTFENESDYEKIDQEDVLEIKDVKSGVEKDEVEVHNTTKNISFKTRMGLSPIEKKSVLAGSLINVVLARHS